MSKLIFISHATEDLPVATDVRSLLGILGFDSFVAHVDIELSQDWVARILEELRRCDGLVYLLSEKAKESNWTDQEVGCAVARDIPIIPLSINTGPWGFVARFQAKRWMSSDREDDYGRIKPNARSLGVALVERRLLGVNELIKLFGQSTAFTDAIIRQIVLRQVKDYSYSQINWLLDLVASNENLYRCTPVRSWTSNLLSEYSHAVRYKTTASLARVGIKPSRN